MKHPLVLAAAVKLGVTLGQEVGRVRTGEVSWAHFKRTLSRHVGGLTGTATGMALGGWAGSIVPGVGTIIGAFSGGLAGQMLGERLTEVSADRVSGGGLSRIDQDDDPGDAARMSEDAALGAGEEPDRDASAV